LTRWRVLFFNRPIHLSATSSPHFSVRGDFRFFFLSIFIPLGYIQGRCSCVAAVQLASFVTCSAKESFVPAQEKTFRRPPPFINLAAVIQNVFFFPHWFPFSFIKFSSCLYSRNDFPVAGRNQWQMSVIIWSWSYCRRKLRNGREGGRINRMAMIQSEHYRVLMASCVASQGPALGNVRICPSTRWIFNEAIVRPAHDNSDGRDDDVFRIAGHDLVDRRTGKKRSAPSLSPNLNNQI
jgi:hypothetical protein